MQSSSTKHPDAPENPKPVAGDEAALTQHSHRGRRRTSMMGLTIGAVGVVYGDIGTSPLYAMREALEYAGRDGLTETEVVGLVSLIIWALTLVVTIKYVQVILRLDNHGEGGILSLLSLAQRAIGRRRWLLMIGLVGAAMFFGDAAITPAISVLSALEGLVIVQPSLDSLVVPVTCLIVFALFAVQRRGTGLVSAFFGPVMCGWFAILAGLGAYWIAQEPAVLAALLPWYAVGFVVEHSAIAMVVMGLVFLAVTGAEALYADLGHFGKRPIRFAWFMSVFPALALNYAGQGALVLHTPAASTNPFYLMAPPEFLVLMVGLATLATIIASQAVITGAFSVARQAVQLGLLPRLMVLHTSSHHEGQVYMPAVNWILCAVVLMLILGFRSSTNLAAAYGIAVSADMLITSILAVVVLYRLRQWNPAVIAVVMLPFIALELLFISANSAKIAEGGYVPLALAGVLMLIMSTWVRGAAILRERHSHLSVDLADVAPMLVRSAVGRAKGTAIYLSPLPGKAPTALMHNFKYNSIIHERNIIVTVVVKDQPRVSSHERAVITNVTGDFTSITLNYGYMENIHVPKALQALSKRGIVVDGMQTSYFLSRRIIHRARQSRLPGWQGRLFVLLTRMASRATDFYQIPSSRSIEVGQQLTI